MQSGEVRRPSIPVPYHSRPAGDAVLANPPPYRKLPWMGMGIPLVSGLLEEHGVAPRIVRFLDDPYDVPQEIGDTCDAVMWGNPPIEQRMAHMRMLAEKYPDFFEMLVARLLEGPERVFGFSAWRLNADVILELARRLKEARPDCFIVVGGPEATAVPADFYREFIDVVVVNGAEGAIGPIFRALVEGRPEEAAVWAKVWVNPRHGAIPPLTPKPSQMPRMPRIDYSSIVPLFLGDPKPVIPVLMNIGCPFHCSFCTNSVLYPDLEWGSTKRLFDEMMQISTAWKSAFGDGEVPPYRLTLCDATANAQPEQFEQLCELMAAAEWPARPEVDGYIVLSGRITHRRIELALAAGFDGFFFGLETASRRLRQVVKKPGTVESVAQALEILRDAGKGKIRITCGVIVGWPGETEEEFYETVAFLDWAATLDVFNEISVNPLIRVPAAEDLGALADAEGSDYGLDWRLPGPAGTPEVRARRTFYVIEHFSGIVPVNTGLPPKLVRDMIEGHTEAFWERWQAAHERDRQAYLATISRREGPQAENDGLFSPVNGNGHANGSEGGEHPSQDAARIVQAEPIDAELRASLESIVDHASGGAWRLVTATQAAQQLDLLVDSAAGAIGVRVAPAVSGARYYRVVGGMGYSYLTAPAELQVPEPPDELHAPDTSLLEQFIRSVHPTLSTAAPAETKQDWVAADHAK